MAQIYATDEQKALLKEAADLDKRPLGDEIEYLAERRLAELDNPEASPQPTQTAPE